MEKRRYPLTTYQKHYYRYWKYAGNITMGNTAGLYEFDKDLASAEELAEAAYKALCCHPSFSTIIYEDENGDPYQEFDSALVTRPGVTTCTESEFEEIKSSLIKPFILKGGELYRCSVYSVEDKNILFLDTHHIITDAASIEIIIRDIISILKGETELPEDQYCEWLEKAAMLKDELKNVLMPGEDYDRYPGFDKNGTGCSTGKISVKLDMSVSEFREAAHKAGSTPLRVLCAAALRAIGEYNGNSKVSVNWLFSGRDTEIKNNITGLLISSIPMPVDLESDASKTDLLSEVRRVNHANRIYSDLSPGNAGSRPVTDDTLTINYTPNDMKTALKGISGVRRIPLFDSNKANSNVFYIIAEEGASEDPFSITFKYNSEVYDNDSIERFKDIFMKHLKDNL